MELKSGHDDTSVLFPDSSNRTFMELKWRTRRRYLLPVPYSSNRTFMELKSGHDDTSVVHLDVLIAPLWN